jgi:hypothetical protein
MKQTAAGAIKAIMAQARSYGGGGFAGYEQGKGLFRVREWSQIEYQEGIKERAAAARI